MQITVKMYWYPLLNDSNCKKRVKLGWIGLDWIGLDWIGLSTSFTVIRSLAQVSSILNESTFLRGNCLLIFLCTVCVYCLARN